MSLDEIGKPAGATNARNGDDVFVPDAGTLHEFEVNGQDGKVAATGTPSRVISCQFLFGERLWLLTDRRGRRPDDSEMVIGGGGSAHGLSWVKLVESRSRQLCLKGCQLFLQLLQNFAHFEG